jgi:type VI secretion system protein ImpH
MATQSRRTDPPLEQLLLEEGYRFDFFQAVRVLERLYPQRQPVGQGGEPAEEVVRFHAHPSLSFPASAIYEVTRPEDENQPAHMTVAFMGLIGPLGVLPRHYTELVLEQGRQKEYALRDFLDLFNHRLISFFYRAWEKYRFPISYEREIAKGEGYDAFSLYLFDFVSMGTKGLRGRLEVSDEALLFYAGLLAQHPRSSSALKGFLQDYFGVPVRVLQFVGQWLFLSNEDRSCLGSNGANNILGESALIGDHVWDQQAKFMLQVGPLTFAEFCRFLPVGDTFRPIVQLARFFVGQEHDFDIQLVLKAKEVPKCELGKTGEDAPRLGWSTWLKTTEFTHDAEDAVFAGRLTPQDPLWDGGSRATERSPA